MLSRVAESLHWMARYTERAENATRLLDVTFHSLLDAQGADRVGAWRGLVGTLGAESEYLEHHEEFTANEVGDWLLWHEGNPSSVVACVTLARENARSVREQISAEMWESVNSLFLLVQRTNRRAASHEPHGFFEQIRRGSHLFQGTAAATMVRGTPYEFIQLGLNLERAATTVRVVGSRYPVAWSLPVDDPARTHELASLLRSCSAFEAYVTRHGLQFEPALVADELVRSPDQPRSVHACLRECLGAVGRISGLQGAHYRTFGRLCAELEYGDMGDASGPTIRAILDRLLAGIYDAGGAVSSEYFSNRALMFGGVAAQEAQQQQCG